MKERYTKTFWKGLKLGPTKTGDPLTFWISTPHGGSMTMAASASMLCFSGRDGKPRSQQNGLPVTRRMGKVADDNGFLDDLTNLYKSYNFRSCN